MNTAIPTVRDHKGIVKTRHDILTFRVVRWTAYHKELLVKAVAKGLVTAEEIETVHKVSAEELAAWNKAYEKGINGLTQLKGFYMNKKEKSC